MPGHSLSELLNPFKKKKLGKQGMAMKNKSKNNNKEKKKKIKK